MRAVLAAADPVGQRNAGNVFKGGGGVDATRIRRCREVLSDPGARVLTGHMPFGVYVSSPSVEADFITFLREPVERALSHYYGQLYPPSKRARVVRTGSKPRSVCLDPKGGRPTQFDPLSAETSPELVFSHLAYVPDNLHTRFLCNSPVPFSPVTAAMLEEAKENLRTRFAFVGLTERLDESMALLGRRFAIDSILTDWSRVNDRRPRGGDVPPEVRRAAEEANRYDAELYRVAVELHDEARTQSSKVALALDLEALGMARTDSGEAGPAPSGFDGGPREWAGLVGTRARTLREARVAGRAGYILGHGAEEVERWIGRLDQRIGRITARAEGRGSEPEGLEALQARRDELAELLDLLRRRQASLVSP